MSDSNKSGTLKVLGMSVDALQHEVGIDAIRQADVVLARDRQTGQRIVFYGVELMEELKRTGKTEGVRVIEVKLDLESNERETLAFALMRLKGWCDLPNAKEAFEQFMAAQRVPLYDPVTDKTVLIPASELAPGAVKVRILGKDGPVWIDGSQLEVTPGELHHPPFSAEVRKQLELLCETFADLYPRTLEEWEAEFRMDLHPEREIAIWMHMRKCYLHFTEGRQLGHDQRQDILAVIVTTMTNGPEQVVRTVERCTLSKRRVREIATYVAATWAEEGAEPPLPDAGA